ncbi:hypothetical protein SNE40_012410 [Patella caerulea]|uniref:Uncharacterized protein n=1 Tax=Patella caerulea TaxID=87958 RepID=A0AAN8JUF6_PATCE
MESQSHKRKKDHGGKIQCTSCQLIMDKEHFKLHCERKHGHRTSGIKFTRILESNQKTLSSFVFATKQQNLDNDSTDDVVIGMEKETSTVVKTIEDNVTELEPPMSATRDSSVKASNDNLDSDNESTSGSSVIDEEVAEIIQPPQPQEALLSVSPDTNPGPRQPILKNYAPRKYGKKSVILRQVGTRSFRG